METLSIPKENHPDFDQLKQAKNIQNIKNLYGYIAHCAGDRTEWKDRIIFIDGESHFFVRVENISKNVDCDAMKKCGDTTAAFSVDYVFKENVWRYYYSSKPHFTYKDYITDADSLKDYRMKAEKQVIGLEASTTYRLNVNQQRFATEIIFRLLCDFQFDLNNVVVTSLTETDRFKLTFRGMSGVVDIVEFSQIFLHQLDDPDYKIEDIDFCRNLDGIRFKITEHPTFIEPVQTTRKRGRPAPLQKDETKMARDDSESTDKV